MMVTVTQLLFKEDNDRNNPGNCYASLVFLETYTNNSPDRRPSKATSLSRCIFSYDMHF